MKNNLVICFKTNPCYYTNNQYIKQAPPFKKLNR